MGFAGSLRIELDSIQGHIDAKDEDTAAGVMQVLTLLLLATTIFATGRSVAQVFKLRTGDEQRLPLAFYN